jgi:hypothetical protein
MDTKSDVDPEVPHVFQNFYPILERSNTCERQ